MGSTSHAAGTRTSALVLVVALGALAGLFVAGEAFDDPGGIGAVGLVASWLVPLAVVSVAAWRRPDATGPLLVVATVALLATDVWAIVDPDAWRSVEDGTGPIRTVAAFALAVCVGVYAFHRPRNGGLLLLVVALGPLAIAALGPGRAAGATAERILAVPLVIAAALYLASVDRAGRLAQ